MMKKKNFGKHIFGCRKYRGRGEQIKVEGPDDRIFT